MSSFQATQPVRTKAGIRTRSFQTHRFPSTAGEKPGRGSSCGARGRAGCHVDPFTDKQAVIKPFSMSQAPSDSMGTRRKPGQGGGPTPGPCGPHLARSPGLLLNCTPHVTAASPYQRRERPRCGEHPPCARLSAVLRWAAWEPNIPRSLPLSHLVPPRACGTWGVAPEASRRRQLLLLPAQPAPERAKCGLLAWPWSAAAQVEGPEVPGPGPPGGGVLRGQVRPPSSTKEPSPGPQRPALAPRFTPPEAFLQNLQMVAPKAGWVPLQRGRGWTALTKGHFRDSPGQEEGWGVSWRRQHCPL